MTLVPHPSQLPNLPGSHWSNNSWPPPCSPVSTAPHSLATNCPVHGWARSRQVSRALFPSFYTADHPPACHSHTMGRHKGRSIQCLALFARYRSHRDRHSERSWPVSPPNLAALQTEPELQEPSPRPLQPAARAITPTPRPTETHTFCWTAPRFLSLNLGPLHFCFEDI